MKNSLIVVLPLCAVAVCLTAAALSRRAASPSALSANDEPPTPPDPLAVPVVPRFAKAAGTRPSLARPQQSAAQKAQGEMVGAAEPPTEKERLVYADGVFSSHAFDPTWASETARHLNAVLAGVPVAGVRVNGVECRTTLCKIELNADDAPSAEKSVKTLVRGMKWEGSGMAVKGDPDARGALTLTLYLARGDNPLPEPPVASP